MSKKPVATVVQEIIKHDGNKCNLIIDFLTVNLLQNQNWKYHDNSKSMIIVK